MGARDELIGAGGVRLHAEEWSPDAEPRSVVVLAHGYAEHLGRYAHVVAALVGRGHAVLALDHRGHGRSDGRRAAVRRFDDDVEDLHLLVRRAAAVHPGRPRFLLGHSMGGLIAVRYALAHQTELAGLIVTGVALIVDERVPPLARRLGRLVARLAPDLPLVPARSGVSSTDPAVERRFRADPLYYNGRTRAGLADELVRTGADAPARLPELTLPLLVMHGAADTLTSPAGSVLLHERAASADKTLELWPGHLHELFNEPGRDAVIGRVLAWLEAHIAPGGRRGA